MSILSVIGKLKLSNNSDLQGFEILAGLAMR